MNRITIKQTRLAVAFAAICLLCLTPLHTARAKPSQQAINASPAIVNLNLSKGRPQAKASITITNGYSVPVRLNASFKSLEPGRQSLTPANDISPGLVDALKVSETDITIPANGKHTVEVQAADQGDLANGGHYAALVLTQQPPDKQPSTYRVALSVNLFMVNTDNSHPAVTLNDASGDGSLFKLPSLARLTLSDTGNVHLVPRAAAIVTDQKGKEYCSGTANQNSRLLLPNQQTAFDTPLTCSATLWWPHRLQTQILYRADSDANPKIKTAAFWYIPPPFAIICVLALLAAGWPVWRRLQPRS